MNRSQAGLVCLIFICSLAQLEGQNAALPQTAFAPASGSSIAVLSFNAAVLGTTEAKKQLGALEQKYSPRQKELQRLNDEIETLRRTVNEKNAGLAQADWSQKLEELSTKEKRLQREAEDFKNDSQVESQQVFQQIAQKLFSFLQDYSQRHGYKLVLDRGTDLAPVVWWAASNVDITEQVTKGYDAKYAVEIPGPQEAPSPTQPSKKIGPPKR